MIFLGCWIDQIICLVSRCSRYDRSWIWILDDFSQGKIPPSLLIGHPITDNKTLSLALLMVITWFQFPVHRIHRSMGDLGPRMVLWQPSRDFSHRSRITKWYRCYSRDQCWWIIWFEIHSYWFICHDWSWIFIWCNFDFFWCCSWCCLSRSGPFQKFWLKIFVCQWLSMIYW